MILWFKVREPNHETAIKIKPSLREKADKWDRYSGGLAPPHLCGIMLRWKKMIRNLIKRRRMSDLTRDKHRLCKKILLSTLFVIAGLTRNLIKWRRMSDLLRGQETYFCHEFKCVCNDLLRLTFFLVVMGCDRLSQPLVVIARKSG